MLLKMDNSCRQNDAAFINNLHRGCFAFGPKLLRPNLDVMCLQGCLNDHL